MNERATDTDTAEAARLCRSFPTAGQLLARERFEYQIARLRTETALGSPRANLDVLVRLCEGLLQDAGEGPMVTHYRAELYKAKGAVSWRDSSRQVSR